MIKRVKIERYKSLHQMELELRPLTVLMGPNAAGKSNFLDALQLLSRIANVQTLKDAFEPPYRGNPLESFSFGAGGMRELLKRDHASFAIEVDVELSENVVESVNHQIREMRRTRSDDEERSERAIRVKENYLRYRIEVEVRPQTGILRVADEYLAALRKDGDPKGSRKPFLERMGNHLRLRLEGQGHPTHIDRYLDQSVLSRPLYSPHYPHMVAMREELSRWFFYYFEPRERMRTPNPVKEVRHIGLMGEELASYLNTLRASDARQFRAVEKALNMIVPSVTGLDVEVNSLGQVELRLEEGAIPVPARLVSEGTLRVLGLLTLSSSQEPASLLGFEEPENGVHPNRVELIAEYLKSQARIGQAQFIITTHSPLLADMLPRNSLFVCQKKEGRTSISPFSSWGPLADPHSIDKALDDYPSLSFSELMQRGDLDA